jgi:hypothetical protein
MFGRNKETDDIYTTFKGQRKKDLYKNFPVVPRWYIDTLFTMAFFSVVGLLMTWGTPTHAKLLDEFQAYLNRCEELTRPEDVESDKKEKQSLLERYPEADVRNWLGKDDVVE